MASDKPCMGWPADMELYIAGQPATSSPPGSPPFPAPPPVSWEAQLTSGLSPGAIAGAVIGSVAGAELLGLLICCLIRRVRRGSQTW